MQEQSNLIDMEQMQASLLNDSRVISMEREAFKGRVDAFLKMHSFSRSTLINALILEGETELSKITLWYTLNGEWSDQKVLNQALTYARQHSILEPYKRHPSDSDKVKSGLKREPPPWN